MKATIIDNDTRRATVKAGRAMFLISAEIDTNGAKFYRVSRATPATFGTVRPVHEFSSFDAIKTRFPELKNLTKKLMLSAVIG